MGGMPISEDGLGHLLTDERQRTLLQRLGVAEPLTFKTRYDPGFCGIDRRTPF